jgi:CTP synthase
MSTEFVSDPVEPVVIFMPEISRTHMGGTMRLGLRPTVFQQDSEWSRIRKLYGGASIVWERHRHRYEVNPAYVERLHTSGLAFIGRDEKGERMQIMELPSMIRTASTHHVSSIHTLSIEHPFFVGLQAHPEFCTRPLNPSPPFLGFVAAACGPDVLEQQMAQQLQSFQPPHPKESMIGEPALIQGSREQLPAASRERVLSISGESGRAT